MGRILKGSRKKRTEPSSTRRSGGQSQAISRPQKGGELSGDTATIRQDRVQLFLVHQEGAWNRRSRMPVRSE